MQRRAETEIVAALAAAQGLKLLPKAGRVTLTGGVWVEVDARSEDGSVFVEAYARQGQLKGAQLKKIGQDVLKLALLKREADYAETRAIIAFASQDACNSVRGWLRRAAEAFAVELCVVSITDELRQQICWLKAGRSWSTSKRLPPMSWMTWNRWRSRPRPLLDSGR